MAAKTVTHTVSLTVDNVSLSLTDSSVATANPTDFVLGTFRADTSYATIPAGDVDNASCTVQLLIKNENTTGSSELQVSLDDGTTINLVLLNGQINLLTTENFGQVKLKSNAGTVDVSYMAVQIGANS
jgi:hypothetical protein|tara:strand:+ start:529 stop:912 length:384 start_codon:yes stop_codon:yes gene_type:complete